MFAFRDPFGIKPIAVGRKQRPDGGWAHAVVSESVVLDMIGYESLETGEPGQAIFINLDGDLSRHQVAPANHHPCVFEFVYFARPDSTIDGASVYRARANMGARLARTFAGLGLEIDVVVPVPDSGRTAALTMAQELGVPYREALVKNRYVGRTFIMPDDGQRRRSIRSKLNTVDEEFRGKRVLLVDDSIVRGNTSRQIIQLARRAGAVKVYFASTSPPLVQQCVYGIDMSTRREFIARDRTREEVARQLGADAVIYQELTDLIDSVRDDQPKIRKMCHACFSGDYPTGDITPEMLLTIEEERITQGK